MLPERYFTAHVRLLDKQREQTATGETNAQKRRVHEQNSEENCTTGSTVLSRWGGWSWGGIKKNRRVIMGLVVDTAYFRTSEAKEVFTRGNIEIDSADDVKTILEQLEKFADSSFCAVWRGENDKRLYCVRDKWGRCSLLYRHREQNLEFCNSCLSTQNPDNSLWKDVGVEGIYAISEIDGTITLAAAWPKPMQFSHENKVLYENPCETLHQRLFDVVKRRVQKIQRIDVAVLFSGGVDSTILASLLAEVMYAEKISGSTESTGTTMPGTIWLCTVMCDGVRSPDWLTSIISFVNLCARHPTTDFRLVMRNWGVDDLEEKIPLALLPSQAVIDFTIGQSLYMAAQLNGYEVSLGEAKVLLDKIAPKKGAQVATPSTEANTPCFETSFGDVPDLFLTEGQNKVMDTEEIGTQKCELCMRYAAKKKCIHFACRFCCKRLSEEQKAQEKSTEKQSGNEKPAGPVCRVHSDEPMKIPSVIDYAVLDKVFNEMISSKILIGPASVNEDNVGITVFCGNGADELFGGYSRYATRLMHEGLEGWRNEMISDLRRLWLRNLGRDDRLMLAAGLADVYHPFLHSSIVEFVASLDTETLKHGRNLKTAESPCSEKANTGKSVTDGTKMLLRNTATLMGLGCSAAFKKRAIQFGTRAAHLEATMNGVSRRRTKASTDMRGLFLVPQ